MPSSRTWAAIARNFWGDRPVVADALLAGARTEVEHRVRVKLAYAEANFGAIDEQLLAALRRLAQNRAIDDDHATTDCAVCGSAAALDGFREVGALSQDRDERANIQRPVLSVVFIAESLACPVWPVRFRWRDRGCGR
jgi:hypothetical protein